MMNFKKVTKTAGFVIKFTTQYPMMSKQSKGPWLKNQIQLLGPTYVKIAQFLSSRPDMFENDKNIIKSLKELQDSSDPIPWDLVEKNVSLKDFSYINKSPLASASIAQVHRATLLDGSDVVIKIKRPNINSEILMDLQILELWLLVYSIFIGFKNNKILDAQNMIKDIQNSILKETDMSNEIENIELFRSINTNVVIPKVYKEYSCSNIIVMEYVPSVKFNLERNPQMAYTLMDIFVQQFLQSGVIHGDPHEGNVALNLAKDKIVMYDLGHIIKLDPKIKSLMKILVFEIMMENTDGVIDIMKQMPDIIDIREKDKVRDYVMKYIQYIKSIDIEILKSMSPKNDDDIPIKFSGEIYEIVRVFGIVEGICLSLDPNFNYQTVFLKYADILLFDREFFDYKIKNDVKKLFNIFDIK